MPNPYITFPLGEASVTVGHPNPAEQLRLVAAIQEAMRPDEGEAEICPNCGESIKYHDGDGVENETWYCESCKGSWSVGIEVKRDWSSIQRA